MQYTYFSLDTGLWWLMVYSAYGWEISIILLVTQAANRQSDPEQTGDCRTRPKTDDKYVLNTQPFSYLGSLDLIQNTDWSLEWIIPSACLDYRCIFSQKGLCLSRRLFQLEFISMTVPVSWCPEDSPLPGFCFIKWTSSSELSHKSVLYYEIIWQDKNNEDKNWEYQNNRNGNSWIIW